MKKETNNTTVKLRLLKRVKRLGNLSIIMLLAYVVISIVLIIAVSSISVRGFLISGSYSDLLDIQISPRSISRFMNGSTEVKTDHKVKFIESDTYLAREIDGYYTLSATGNTERMLYYPATSIGFLIDDILIDTYGKDRIIVHPKDLAKRDEDICEYDWYNRSHISGEVNREYVLDILRRQDKEAISVGEAATIIGLMKEGELLGYFDECAMFVDERDNKNREISVTWLADNFEKTCIMQDVDFEKGIVGVGNCAVYANSEGKVVLNFIDRYVHSYWINATHPVDDFCVSLNYLDSDIEQPVYISIYSKDILITLSQKVFGDYELKIEQSASVPSILPYKNICGSYKGILLWNDFRHHVIDKMVNSLGVSF